MDPVGSRFERDTDSAGALPDSTPHGAGAVGSSGDMTALIVLETLQSVLVAIILALVFRAFLIEPFLIPTGSMSPTLRGEHVSTRCPRCAWSFTFGEARAGAPTDPHFWFPSGVRCPQCELSFDSTTWLTELRGGDRILVDKWSMLVRPTERWDVVVFQDPADLQKHFIKRVVGLPGEKIELLGGDVFVDGRPVRKPSVLQARLWRPVYRSAFAAAQHIGRLPPEAPWALLTGAVDAWSEGERVLRCSVSDPAGAAVRFVRPLRTGRVYNEFDAGVACADLRVAGRIDFDAASSDPAEPAWVEIHFAGAGHRWMAHVSADGQVMLSRSKRESDRPDAAAERGPLPQRDLTEWQVTRASAQIPAAQSMRIEFAHVDRRSYLKINERVVLELTDRFSSVDLEALRDQDLSRWVTPDAELALRGFGQFALSEIEIDQDVHYVRSSLTRRAVADLAVTLGPDEFFVLGDNPARSHDGREWTRLDPLLRHRAPDFAIGTVHRDLIVGRAWLVYYPGFLSQARIDGISPPPAESPPFIDVGLIRFIP